ncbi:MAG: hypothetical protein KME32_09340 [Mojavia pulchra JT2-VF2]|jgi:hypothetical protein|uniref:Uncharacterized protein n=1 Tax=Mojavia pulchra JT2-VF2 TaxID=287848 RepID=A0A951UFD6_9NOST|nr:hypothetical protein [Mojavia pulchra JT2-VF2]
MSTATVKTCSLRRKISRNTHSFGRAIALFIMLWGCSAPSFNSSSLTWKTYSNSRYNFEFPYPSNWTALPPPDNDDGVAFIPPQTSSVEIRSWAGNRLADSISQNPEAKITVNPNFKTAQGVSGVMVVEVGPQVSSMTLTLTQGQVKYYWQGRSQSQKFSDYYRLFSYIAYQYKIPN